MPRREPETRLAHKRRPTILCTSREVLATKGTASATLCPRGLIAVGGIKITPYNRPRNRRLYTRAEHIERRRISSSPASIPKFYLILSLAERELLKSKIIQITRNYFSDTINLMLFECCYRSIHRCIYAAAAIRDDRYLQISKSYIGITYT